MGVESCRRSIQFQFQFQSPPLETLESNIIIALTKTLKYKLQNINIFKLDFYTVSKSKKFGVLFFWVLFFWQGQGFLTVFAKHL